MMDKKKERKPMISLTVDQELKNQLETIAKSMHIPTTCLIMLAINDYLKKTEENNKK